MRGIGGMKCLRGRHAKATYLTAMQKGDTKHSHDACQGVGRTSSM